VKQVKIWSRSYLEHAAGTSYSHVDVPAWGPWNYFVQVDDGTPGEKYCFVKGLPISKDEQLWERKVLINLFFGNLHNSKFWEDVISSVILPDIPPMHTKDNKKEVGCRCDISQLWNGFGHNEGCSER